MAFSKVGWGAIAIVGLLGGGAIAAQSIGQRSPIASTPVQSSSPVATPPAGRGPGMGHSPSNGPGNRPGNGPGMGHGPGGMGGNMNGDMNGGMGGMMHVQDEYGFLAHMIPHHQEAVDTAKIIADRSQRPEMKQFAQAIITAQTKEIGDMGAWLKAWYPSRTDRPTYQPMMRDLTGLSGDALDRQFLQDMIHHHQGAVMMARQLIQRRLSQHSETNNLAQAIVTSQTQEIGQMQTWLKTWFGDEGMGRSRAGCHRMPDGSAMCM